MLLPSSSSTPVPLLSLPFDGGSGTLPSAVGRATVEVDLQAVISSIRSGTHSLLLWLSKPK